MITQALMAATAAVDPNATGWFQTCRTAGSEPPQADKNATNTFFQTLKGKNLWPITDRVWNLAAASAIQALIDMKALNQSASAVNSPSFAASGGYTGNGTTSYLNLGYNPGAGGFNLTQNSAGILVYPRTSRAAGANTALYGVTSVGSGNVLWPWFGDNVTYYDINDDANTGNSATHPANVQGAWVASRTGSAGASASISRNATSLGTGSLTSQTIVSGNIFVCCYNSGGTPTNFSTDQIAFFWAGGGLTSTQVTDLTNAVNALATAQGWNTF